MLHVTNETKFQKTVGTGYVSWNESTHRSVTAAVFGELVGLAAPDLAAFKSDLFYDALGLDDMIRELSCGKIVMFRYSWDSAGTTFDGGFELPTRENVAVIRVERINERTFPGGFGEDEGVAYDYVVSGIVTYRA